MATTADVPKNIMFWSGAFAGMASATSTHFLDVGKVAKQVGRSTPNLSFDPYWMRGLSFGAVAQGQRFATTLTLDYTLQHRLKELQLAKGHAVPTITDRICSFGVSMFASGLSEFLANPPVAIKNYQIANDTSPSKAMKSMYGEKSVHSFFRGVTAGVLRKSLANAIVLQTISPAKQALSHVLYLDASHNEKHAALAGFLAGGITGGLAEVVTNPFDRVKTLMQAKPNMSVGQACKEAATNPLQGAGYAFVRKGAIRAINWGIVGVLVTLYQSYGIHAQDVL